MDDSGASSPRQTGAASSPTSTRSTSPWRKPPPSRRNDRAVTTPANTLDAVGVGLTYRTTSGEIEALRGISLSVREGEFISVVGPSGCGKSSLLKLILGLERAT